MLGTSLGHPGQPQLPSISPAHRSPANGCWRRRPSSIPLALPKYLLGLAKGTAGELMTEVTSPSNGRMRTGSRTAGEDLKWFPSNQRRES